MNDSSIVWDFFLAHAGADTTAAESLYDLLSPHSKVFLDSRCLILGDDWDLELARAQSQSLITVVIISSRSDEAYYQREEVAAAIEKSRRDKTRHRVVPVYLDGYPSDGNVPYGLRLKHGLSVRDSGGVAGVAQLLVELLKRLNGEDTTNAIPERIREGEQKFDALLTYSALDRPIVLQVATELVQAGVKVWFDVWEVAPGTPVYEALDTVLQTIRASVVFVGPSGLGPWEVHETRAIIERAVFKRLPVIPVLLPGTPSSVDLPLLLRGVSVVDLRDGLTQEGINKIIWGITGQRPTASEKEQLLISAQEPDLLLQPTSLEEVFRTVGLPEYTYVEPKIYRHVAQAIQQPGKHVVIEGPSGSGKTCMVYRILRELGYKKDAEFRYLSATSEDDLTEISKAAGSSTSQQYPLTIIDDFHFLPIDVRTLLAKRLKVLSDEVFSSSFPPKFILIGIPSAAQGLTFKMHDLGPRLGVYKMPYATGRQLSELIAEGEKRLLIRFPRPNEIIDESNNSFYLCQYICHEICFLNNIQGTGDSIVEVGYRMSEIRDYLMEELNNRYQSALLTFLKKAGSKQEEKSGLIAITRALGEVSKPVVHLGEIIGRAGKDGLVIEKLKKQIRHYLFDHAGDITLAQLLNYDDGTEIFTIENPTFHYYLRHLNLQEIGEAVGFFPSFDTSLINKQQVIPPTTSGEAQDSHRESALSSRDQVFISYSHRDAQWVNMLQTTLRPLVRNSNITVWADTQIRAGAKWYDEIQRALSLAKVAVLLVSPDFLASDFIATHELPILLEASEREGLTILWVAVSASLYEETEIGKYQAVNNPSEPLDSLAPAKQNQILVEVCKRIKEALSN